MRVCMLSWRGPTHPNAGGAEAYTAMVMHGLANRGHAVTWYVGAPGADRLAPPTDGGVRMVYGASGMTVYWSGHRWIQRHASNYDVVIDQLNTFGFRAPSVGPHVVALVHQLALDVWDYEALPGVSHIGRYLEQQVLRQYRATPFVTVSASTLQDLRAHGWQGPGQIIPNVLPDTVQPAHQPRSPHPSLIFLGRLGSRAKRLDHTVRIWSQVRADWPDTELWVVGRGQVPDHLRGRPGLRIYSNADAATRDALLAQAWCLLATSVREGWGRMVMEAAGQGTPAVVYDVPGLRDAVIDRVTGRIVSVSPEHAAIAVQELFAHPERRDQWGLQAQQAVQQQSPDRFVDQWETFLNAVQTHASIDEEREDRCDAL
jgi:glycosyltransferase involved in cell wall biosynthesis